MLSGAGLDKYFIFNDRGLLEDGIANRDSRFADANAPEKGDAESASKRRIAKVLTYLNTLHVVVRLKNLGL